jgi:hypothetical protein
MMSEDFLRKAARRRNLREREHGSIFAPDNRIHIFFLPALKSA